MRTTPQPIRAVLKQRRITLSELARELEMTVSNVNEYVNGVRKPSGPFMDKASAWLGIPAAELFRLETVTRVVPAGKFVR